MDPEIRFVWLVRFVYDYECNEPLIGIYATEATARVAAAAYTATLADNQQHDHRYTVFAQQLLP